MTGKMDLIKVKVKVVGPYYNPIFGQDVPQYWEAEVEYVGPLRHLEGFSEVSTSSPEEAILKVLRHLAIKAV